MGASTALIAAQATMAVGSAYGQHKAGGVQEDISKAEATITHAQQEHQIARQAAVESEQYRRDLASTVAAASARGGAGMARQFGGQAQSSYARDIEAINRAYSVNDIQKQNKEAQASAMKSATTNSAIMGLGKDILGAAAFSYAIPKTPKMPAGITGLGVIPAIPKYAPNNPYAPTSNYSGTQSGKWSPLG